MISPTVAPRQRTTKESRDRFFSGAPLIRAARVRDDAARFSRDALKGNAKHYAPYLSPQKLSELRRHGGSIGDVGVLMLANPAAAMRIAEHLHALARQITAATCHGDLRIVLRDAQRADSREDCSRTDVLADETPETLRRHLADLDAAIAEGQRARDAIARRLEEMERAR